MFYIKSVHILAFVIIMLLSACGQNTPESSPEEKSDSMHADAQKNLTAAESAPKAEWPPITAAEGGDAEAQNTLGRLYSTGDGVPKDAGKAFEWYQKAAEQGHAHAQGFVGVAYRDGVGIGKDNVLAYAWLSLAASNGADLWIDVRDSLEREMNRRELAEGQRLASNWKPGTQITREQASGR